MGGGGGGGGGFGGGYGATRAAAQHEAERGEYETDVNALLDDVLKDANARDTETIRSHVSEIRDALEGDLEATVPLIYGGSVRKHTYVNGLSDVDMLAIINKTDLADATPQQALSYLASRLRERFGNRADVKASDMAVTVTTADGHQIQVLPALRTATGVRVPSTSHMGWSNVARPQGFASKLTEINQQNGNGVVPTIKAFKALQDKALPANSQLKGYHIESMAIEAFRDYNGRLSRKEMLRHFVDRASILVRSPMVDSTGQSRHVDEYLGGAGTWDRARTAQALSNLGKKLDAADRARDRAAWEDLFRE